MDSSILSDTQAFITKQRDALLQQRESISTQQHELQQQLDAVNAMLAKFDVFEGKAAARAPAGRTRRTTTARSGSRRDELLLAQERLRVRRSWHSLDLGILW